MFDSATPDDLTYQLPADTYCQLVRTLRLTLPPPPGDSAEDLRRRDHAAIAAVAGLAPANAAEARLAAHFVAASEQSMDCLRLAQLPETTPEWAAKCRAQAASMMRQANSALRLLLHTQDARRKLEADNAACNRAAWTEHVATRVMAEALAGHPKKSGGLFGDPVAHHPHPDPLEATPQNRADLAGTPAEGEGEGASSPLPLGEGGAGEEPAPDPIRGSAGEAGGIACEGQGEGQAAPPAIPEPEPALTGAAATRRLKETDPELIAAAERYAATYPERAAQIRRTGKVPYDIRYFEPSEFALVRALVAARTPALLALDHAFSEASAG